MKPFFFRVNITLEGVFEATMGAIGVGSIGVSAYALKGTHALDNLSITDDAIRGIDNSADEMVEGIIDSIPEGNAYQNNPLTLQTGGRQIDYNAYIKRLETIDIEYEDIRINTTDVSKIAQNTGMPEWKINRIKEHVFFNEHILDSGIKKFDADPEIADAWYRLTNGTFNQNDIDLLNHEYFESKIERVYKIDYRTAHGKTEESGRIWDPYKEEK